MTLANGQITVRIALELGPNDEPPLPADPAWTDLTSRVRSYRDRRGRTDVLREFQPGTADVVLDNGDRMLDPSNEDGLLYSGATRIGLPLCPVQIGVMWGGVEYPKFYGYLGPEAWPGDLAPHGPSGTVTLSVMDALGHSPGLPQDTWGLIVSALQPEWLSRMDDTEFPVLDDGSHVPNSLTGSGCGRCATCPVDCGAALRTGSWRSWAAPSTGSTGRSCCSPSSSPQAYRYLPRSSQ